MQLAIIKKHNKINVNTCDNDQISSFTFQFLHKFY